MLAKDFFLPPSNPDESIWRYIDFPKYVSLLVTKSLYFSRSDLLGDPYEGSYPVSNKLIREEFAETLAEHFKDKVGDPQFWNNTFLKKISANHKGIAKSVYINCWHINSHESAAMWSIYSKNNRGIAIQSSYKKLRECFPGNNIHIGKVNYIDFEKDTIPEVNVLLPFVYKRKSYEHERELRALIFDVDTKAFQKGTWPSEQAPGITRPINAKKLISNIYIAPHADSWYEKIVIDVTRKYGLKNVDVIRSPLENEPFY